MKDRFRYTLLIPLFLICPFFLNGQACIDSSFRILYSTSAEIFSIRHHCNASSGGIIMAGTYGLLAEDRDAFVMKVEPGGRVLWSRMLFSPGNALLISRVVELSDNTILLIGTFGAKDLTDSKVFIVKLDNAGNLLWNKFYEETGSPTAWQLFFYSVAEAPGGKILATWKRAELGNVPDDSTYATVCCLDPAGNIVWVKTFYANSNENNINPSGIFYQNNDVIVTGQVSDYSGPASCMGTGNFFAMRLNFNDGTLLQTTAYCYTEPQSNSQLLSSPDIHFSAIRMSNNNFALYGLFHNFDQNNYYYSLILDEQFSRVQSEIFALPHILATANSKIQVLADENIHLSAVSNFSKTIYWAVFDSAYQVKRQKKIPFIVDNSSLGQYYQFSSNLTGSLNFTSGYRAGAQKYLEWGQFQHFSPEMESCFNADTSFITTMPFLPTPINYEWKAIKDNGTAPSTVGITVSDITVTKNEACKLVSNCTNLTITGNDTICATGHEIFTAHKNPGCFNSVNWDLDTGLYHSLTYLNDSTISVLFKNPGGSKRELLLSASAGNCNVAGDTLRITIFPEVKPLGEDTILCPTGQVALGPGGGFRSYRWQDGSGDSVFMAREPGLYHVQVETWCGEIIADTIAVSVLHLPGVDLGFDTTICESDPVYLNAGAGFVTYLWNTGSSSQQISVNKAGMYAVEVTDTNGCRRTDTIAVKTKNCTNKIVFPNAFTPNGDGRNDLFKPIVTGKLIKYKLVIYNRWGEQIFTSYYPSFGWNGRLRNSALQSDGYVWICTYQFEHEEPMLEKGFVALVGK